MPSMKDNNITKALNEASDVDPGEVLPPVGIAESGGKEEVKQSTRGRPRKGPNVDWWEITGKVILRIAERIDDIYRQSYSSEVKEKCKEVMRDLELLYNLFQGFKR